MIWILKTESNPSMINKNKKQVSSLNSKKKQTWEMKNREKWTIPVYRAKKICKEKTPFEKGSPNQKKSLCKNPKLKNGSDLALFSSSSSTCRFTQEPV